MEIKGIIDEDFTQYKKPAMFIAMPYCSFKCEKDCGKKICQNSNLAKAENIHIEVDDLIKRYLDNPITKAIVFGGLDPIDSFYQLKSFIKTLRYSYNCDDDVVIYTGYKKEEIELELAFLSQIKNIIIKFGRYVPDQKPHFDEVLGIELASDNQYAERLPL